MKAKDLIEILQTNPELEVMTSKGTHTAEVMIAEERKMCRYDHGNHTGYWRNCQLKLCGNETQQAFFLT